MPQKGYAELELYFGLVNSGRLGEGIFDSNSTDRYSKERYISELKWVYEQVETGRVELGWDPFVQSEEEAKLLIDFSRKNISGAEGLIRLTDSMHGKTRFWRILKFNNWNEKQKNNLISKLKESGYTPRNEELEKVTLFRDLYSSKKFQERLSQIDMDKPWKENLKFF